MTPHLERLLYVSRVTALAAARLPDAMEEILLQSHRHNGMRRVTGLLWCDGVSFIQVLEGPAAAIRATYSRIQTDPRHRDVTLRLRDATTDRLFPAWTMCGLTLSDLDDAVLLAEEPPLDTLRGPPDALLAMLRRIAEGCGERLDRIHRRIAAAA